VVRKSTSDGRLSSSVARTAIPLIAKGQSLNTLALRIQCSVQIGRANSALRVGADITAVCTVGAHTVSRTGITAHAVRTDLSSLARETAHRSI
jgi:hypothetical protein